MSGRIAGGTYQFRVESSELKVERPQAKGSEETQRTTRTIDRFEDLAAWKLAFQIAVQIYKTTDNFPASERFGLRSQLRRCAASIPANIAEGFGRYALKEYLRFLFYSRGSIAETQSHLRLALELGFIDEDNFNRLYGMCVEARKTLQGLIRHVRKMSETGIVAEGSPQYSLVSSQSDDPRGNDAIIDCRDFSLD